MNSGVIDSQSVGSREYHKDGVKNTKFVKTNMGKVKSVRSLKTDRKLSCRLVGWSQWCDWYGGVVVYWYCGMLIWKYGEQCAM